MRSNRERRIEEGFGFSLYKVGREQERGLPIEDEEEDNGNSRKFIAHGKLRGPKGREGERGKKLKIEKKKGRNSLISVNDGPRNEISKLRL